MNVFTAQGFALCFLHLLEITTVLFNMLFDTGKCVTKMELVVVTF